MTTGAKVRRYARALPRLFQAVPLAAALAAAGLLARRTARRPAPEPRAGSAPGLSVIIPERGTPDLLDETLAALDAALAGVGEPVQVIVVVNGADPVHYASLCTKHPAIEWDFHVQALGFNGAIAAGLARARHDWTYLLNSDMRLDPGALSEVLAQRRPRVFAIVSQIFFSDPARRREETGWSDFRANPETPQMYERDLDPHARLLRGSLYPGGGSSLCRTEVLRRYVRGSGDYRPFYWEDADWGVRAWGDGWEVLCCPTSHTWHHHRGTVRRFFEPAEVDRIVARNALLFDLRHAWTSRRAATLLRTLMRLDARSFGELRGVGLAWRVFRSRLATLRARRRGLRFETLTLDRWYAPASATPAANSPRRPRVLLVSPFALFPPAHGGARRVAELVAYLRDDVEFLLLGDEGSLYGAQAEPWFEGMQAVRLVEGRGDQPLSAPPPLVERLRRHVWPGLQAELARMVERYDPDIVQVEFMELAALAATRSGRARWILALHDVYLSADGGDASGDAAQIAAMSRFDALTVCSPEDAALLPPQLPATLIGNGAADRRAAYAPSPSAPRLLFMGPFRYAQNREGIVEFIDTAWPALRRQFPDITLTILGGAESAEVAASDARLRQPGIELVSAFVDPAPRLHDCALTINPQCGIRGSSIKLIESLLAGRVCVSTMDGARGFADAALTGLAIAPTIAAMAEPIAALLAEPGERRRRERADGERLDAFTWKTMASRQLALYDRLVGWSDPK